MNERIKQLVKQATEDVMKNTPSFLVTNEMWQEKFAELIVRQCCFVGEQYADGLFDPKHYAFVNKKIKQHFGIS